MSSNYWSAFNCQKSIKQNSRDTDLSMCQCVFYGGLVSVALLCWCWCRLATSIRLQRARSLLQGRAALSAARTHLNNTTASLTFYASDPLPTKAPLYIHRLTFSHFIIFQCNTLATVGESRPWVGVSGGLEWWWEGWITVAAVLFILRAMMGEAEPARLTSAWLPERGGVGKGGLTEDRGWGLGELCGLWVFRGPWSVSRTFRGSTWADLAGGVDSDTHLLREGKDSHSPPLSSGLFSCWT